MRAVVIDDSKAAREILADLLTGIGFEVHKARNGREGLDLLKGIEKADVILVDWFMPEMNGLAFIQALRADPAYDSVSVVMVTTQTEMPQVARALEAGADEYIMKPVSREMIVEKLQLLGIQAP